MGEIITFAGAAHGAGTTMTASSVTRHILALKRDWRVLYVGMNAGGSDEYLDAGAHSIDGLMLHLKNRTLHKEEIRLLCRITDNFYMLAGSRNLVAAHEYFPEMAEYLLGLIKDEFDLIICDAGNDLDNGLAMGALNMSDSRYCVVSQNEKSYRSYEASSWLYKKLGITYDGCILNKYYPKDPYDLTYTADRLSMDEDKIFTLPLAGYSRQAEMDHKTLFEYRSNDDYRESIRAFTKALPSGIGEEIKIKRRGLLWLTGSI